ncbi:MAG TPA: endonuclease domain-containing protein [Patescibacteria group bacterium]|nr:endonuclease domain-containing protein [Patescibacteria group bacterium]
MLGYQFFRQKIIGYYIVDLFCPVLKLIVEIDGFSHNEKVDYDNRRGAYLNKQGLNILRFQEKHVRQNIENVIQIIVDWIDQHPPRPPQGGN